MGGHLKQDTISQIARILKLLFNSSPKSIRNRILKHTRQYLGRVKAAQFGTELKPKAFYKALKSNINCDVKFLERVKEGPYPAFFVSADRKDKTVNIYRTLCPTSEKTILHSADAVCNHRFDLLGSGLCFLGERIQWHTDFKTGYHWDPHVYYLDIHYAPSPGGFDIKLPWELSRCQHFAWLGQAYWLTGDEKYAREFRNQAEDWIQKNPPQYGVNWVCTMDVALRAINWLWGYAFFRQSPSLEDNFHLLFYRSLLSHGRHIMSNLEWSEKFTGNHYLSDIVGLVYLGILLPEFRESERWLKFGLEALETEMDKQVYPDGVGFEASTNYHRLSTELFLSATLLAEMNGHTFSQSYIQRLERMIDNIRIIAHPDGTMPVIGDQDNGRIHRLKVWDYPEREWLDFRYLLAIGAAWKGNLTWASATGDNWEEAAWMLPDQATHIYSKRFLERSDPKPQGLSDGGWYVLQNKDFHVLVDLGPNGQNGNGGHAHNDSMSFSLFCQNQLWILDPGTYTYTYDYDARNLLRSTEMHNTVNIEVIEQNWFDPKNLFQMEPNSINNVSHWESTANDTLLIGSVNYFKPSSLVHKRIFYLDHTENIFVIQDKVMGHPGVRRVKFHFYPEMVISHHPESFTELRLENKNQEQLYMLSMEKNKSRFTIAQSWVSQSYGCKQTCPSVVFEWEGNNPHTIAFVPVRNGKSLNAEVISGIQCIANRLWEL